MEIIVSNHFEKGYNYIIVANYDFKYKFMIDNFYIKDYSIKEINTDTDIGIWHIKHK